ncbi:hypothetical protein [Bifidobacterium vespertilionis]|uniref:hypothetical protein n=1 Tax=Bifidobacterium vespertilionis TaxID=2562524 RepID=UPI001BDCE47F|nr:hypothetical protein [Bifidobacterium vespertilionis]MBT1178264.1 hypothetical protein [Bifidobacterium vespertilionis]
MEQQHAKMHEWVTGDHEFARRQWKGLPLWVVFLLTVVFASALAYVFFFLVPLDGSLDRVIAALRLPAGWQGRLILGAAFVVVATLGMIHSSWNQGRGMPDDLVGVDPDDFDLDLRYGSDYRDSDGDTQHRRISAIVFTPDVHRTFTLPMRRDDGKLTRVRFTLDQGQIRCDGDDGTESREDDYRLDEGVTMKGSIAVVS